MVVDHGLVSKRGPNLLRMRILLFSDCMTAEFIVECIVGWESCLAEPVPGVHVVVWVDLIAEKDSGFRGLCAGELNRKMVDLVSPNRPMILVNLLEGVTQELKSFVYGDDFAE